MSEPTIEEIIRQVQDPALNVADLLETYRTQLHIDKWSNLRLCRAFVKRLIADDRVQKALDLLRDCLALHPLDLKLKYYEAIAHTRARNHTLAPQAVHKLVQDVEANLKVEAEVLCLAGGLYKDKIASSTSREERQQLARKAGA